jgi:hypothetical protein
LGSTLDILKIIRSYGQFVSDQNTTGRLAMKLGVTELAQAHGCAQTTSGGRYRKLAFGTLTFLSATLAACGGGSGSSRPQVPITITVSADQQTVQPGATALITATVRNDTANRGRYPAARLPVERSHRPQPPVALPRPTRRLLHPRLPIWP